jgi:hypothetical protein
MYKIVYDTVDDDTGDYSEVHLPPDHSEHTLIVLESGTNYRIQVGPWLRLCEPWRAPDSISTRLTRQSVAWWTDDTDDTSVTHSLLLSLSRALTLCVSLHLHLSWSPLTDARMHDSGRGRLLAHVERHNARRCYPTMG